MERAPGGEILLYQTEDGQTRVEVHLEDETVWLTQNKWRNFFKKISARLINIFGNILEEGEWKPDSVVRNFRTTAADGKTYNILYYNLDGIISVGYRLVPDLGHAKVKRIYH